MKPRLRKRPRGQGDGYLGQLLVWRYFRRLFDGSDSAAWVDNPKWRQRYKALRRSTRNHGRMLEVINAPKQVQREWEAQL